jgi:hypothetical protein
MTAEGVFPKIAGDIAYASEANRFARAGGFISNGSFYNVISSGTAFQVMGSIVIGAGSLTNPCELQILFKNEKNARDNLSISISGASANGTCLLGSVITNCAGRVNIYAGSPFEGIMLGYSAGWSADYAANTHSAISLTNLDTSAPVVISFGANASANQRINSYSIQAFRGSL